MKRPIVAFHQDPESQWVAELACGHRRHTRHDPPLSDEKSLPAALQRLHAMKPGIVVPEVEHHLELSGPVSLFVEFWRPAGASCS